MPSNRPGEGTAGAFDAAVDRVHAAPLEAFVALRKTLVAELRAGGDRAGALALAGIAKPSRTAWALNQVARQHPELVQAALAARATAAEAPKEGDGERMRATARAYRECVGAVVAAATAIARAGGADLTPAQGRTIGETLQAIAGGEDAQGRAALLAGRLAGDVEVEDPFAGIEAGEVRARPVAEGAGQGVRAGRAGGARDVEHAPHRAHAAHPPAPSKDAHAHAEAARVRAARAREEQARLREEEARRVRERALEEARARVAALEEQVREARAAARVAEVAAARAQADAERLRRVAADIEKELAAAKAGLRSHGV